MKKFFTLQNYCFLDTYTSTQNSHFFSSTYCGNPLHTSTEKEHPAYHAGQLTKEVKRTNGDSAHRHRYIRPIVIIKSEALLFPPLILRSETEQEKMPVITKRADTETRQVRCLPCFTLCTRIYARAQCNYQAVPNILRYDL